MVFIYTPQKTANLKIGEPILLIGVLTWVRGLSKRKNRSAIGVQGKQMHI